MSAMSWLAHQWKPSSFLEVELPWLLVLLVTGCVVVRTIYRLYFHPLSKIPGPRLAAISSLYEFYYDVVKGGMYIWEVEKMHRQYGPIVRINPYEVHVIDPDFYDEICASGSRRREKDPRQVSLFGAPGSMIATVGHEQHKMRRGLVRGHFSRKAIVNIEPIVQEKLDKMIQLFHCAYKKFAAVNTSDAFSALTADVIAVYALGIDLDFLDGPEFKNDFQEASLEADMLCHVFKFFPWLLKLSQLLPDNVVRFLQPSANSLLMVQKTIHDQSVATLQKASKPSSDSEARSNIFDSLSHPSVPSRERTLSRMQDEGLILLAAGTETTARALAVCAFHLAANKTLMQKLRSELKDVMPSPDSRPSWAQLERLPYLVRHPLPLSLCFSNYPLSLQW